MVFQSMHLAERIIKTMTVAATWSPPCMDNLHIIPIWFFVGLFNAKGIDSGFTNLSSMSCSDLGCWVYYEDTIPSTPRSEHRSSVPNGGCGP
jgi:hypothetical protein